MTTSILGPSLAFRDEKGEKSMSLKAGHFFMTPSNSLSSISLWAYNDKASILTRHGDVSSEIVAKEKTAGIVCATGYLTGNKKHQVSLGFIDGNEPALSIKSERNGEVILSTTQQYGGVVITYDSDGLTGHLPSSPQQ